MSTPPPDAEAPRAPADLLATPEFEELRKLRRAFGRGGLPMGDKRTPEDHARIVAFRVLAELLRLLGDYRRRIGNGERVRLVERENPSKEGRLVLDIRIEVVP